MWQARGNPIARFNGELDLVRWHGPATISAQGIFQYSLDWSVLRPVSHHYGAFIQLLTPDWERVAGDDRYLYRWLYPTIAWDTNDRVPVAFELDIEEPLAPGAYRLAAGSWYVNGGLMPAQSFVGESISTAATIAGSRYRRQDSQPYRLERRRWMRLLPAASCFSHVDARIESQDRVTVVTYWTAPEERVGIDATSFVHAFDKGAALLAQSDRRPWGGQYPTLIWG